MAFDGSEIPQSIGAKLALIGGSGPYQGARFPIVTLPLTIGRKPPNDLILDQDGWVSSNHCRIIKTDRGIFIEDLGSANGTFVNGKRINPNDPTLIIPGRNTIALGKTLFDFVDEGAAVEDMSSKTLNINDLIATKALGGSKDFLGTEREEALFVVDICRSTFFGGEYGEKALFSVLIELAKSITRNADMDVLQSMAHTGDGFMVTFKETGEAVAVAAKLLQDLERFTPDGGAPNPGVRITIHYDKVVATVNGARMGIATKLITELDKAGKDNLVKAPPQPLEIPERDRIIITGQAVATLKGRLADSIRPVGLFKIKDFEPIEIHLVTGDLNTVISSLGPQY
jgi:pSer/pThr/pTyr-binding forkhead associated (FHA) protein